MVYHDLAIVRKTHSRPGNSLLVTRIDIQPLIMQNRLDFNDKTTTKAYYNKVY